MLPVQAHVYGEGRCGINTQTLQVAIDVVKRRSVFRGIVFYRDHQPAARSASAQVIPGKGALALVYCGIGILFTTAKCNA